MLTNLRSKNPGFPIFGLGDPRLKTYGCKVTGIDFSEIIAAANTLEIPEGVRYAASLDILEKDPAKIKEIERKVYGESPVQIGLCWGKSTHLNGLEWHKDSELTVAATDLVLLLALYTDMDESPTEGLSIHTNKVVGLYLPAGGAVELYPLVLHLAPCQVSAGGFRAVIILPKGTNGPLGKNPADDRYLTAVNKWFIGHHAGGGPNDVMYGENLEVKY